MVQNGGWKRMCLRQCSCSSWLCSFHSLHCRPAGKPEKLTREKKKAKMEKWKRIESEIELNCTVTFEKITKRYGFEYLYLCVYQPAVRGGYQRNWTESTLIFVSRTTNSAPKKKTATVTLMIWLLVCRIYSSYEVVMLRPNWSYLISKFWCT